MIVFPTPIGLMRVSAAGGSALPLTALNHSRGEIGHFFPRILPDGRHFIYLRVSPGADVTGLYVGSLDVKPEEQDLTRIVATRTNGEYAPSATHPALGDLLFVRDGTLIGQRFDAARRQLVGDPVPVAEQVAEAGNPSGRFAYFSVSQTGVLAYRQRQVVTGTPVWVDRSGRELASVVDAPLDELINVRLSPDDSRLAVIAAGDVWVYDLTGRPPIKLTFDGGNDMPLWTPDGQRVIYARTAPPLRLLSVSAVQGGTPEPISPEGHYHPHGWSPDGDLITVLNSYSPTWWDVLRLPPTKGMDPKPLLQTPGFEGEGGAALSPDGRWLAYTFDGTGREEVWVAPYPGPGAPERVSSNGGAAPVWAKNGRELYYLEGRKMMSVSVQTAPLVRFERATMLFESSYGPAQSPNASYDVAADGRFLMIKGTMPRATASPVHVVFNWAAGMAN